MQTKTSKHKGLIIRMLYLVGIAGILVFTPFCRADSFEQSGTVSQESLKSALYIPTNYLGESPQSSHTIEVMIGEVEAGFDELDGEEVMSFGPSVFHYDPDEIIFDDDPFSFVGTPFEGDVDPANIQVSVNEIDDDNAELTVGFSASAPHLVEEGDILFRLSLSIPDGLGWDLEIDISATDVKVGILNEAGDAVINSLITTITAGKIRIPPENRCLGRETCNDHGVCNDPPGYCACDSPGYDPAVDCGACADGYSGYPNCMFDVFLNLDEITLGLDLADQETINGLTTIQQEEIFQNVLVAINSSNAVGHTITLEGVTVPILLNPPTDFDNELERINAIMDDPNGDLDTSDGLITRLNSIADIAVTQNPTSPGVLIIQPTGQNELVDISTSDSTTEHVTIFGSLSRTIILHPTSSLGMKAVGTFDNGTTMALNLEQLTWVISEPYGRLNNPALNGARLEMGDDTGSSNVYVKILKSDTTEVFSNTLSVNVPSGPIVESAIVLGDKTIFTPNELVQLRVTLSDVDQVSDITEIVRNLVETDYDTYDEIIANVGIGDWVSAQPLATDDEIEEVVGDDAGAAAAGGEVYSTYEMPIRIPSNVLDGSYKIVLEIRDNAGHTATAVIPGPGQDPSHIVIGEFASGDVNLDGDVDLLDAIMNFKIFLSSYTPTPEQIQAGNVSSSNDNEINWDDVIMLWDQVSQ